MDLFGGAKKTTKTKKTTKSAKTSDAKKTKKTSDAKKTKKSTTTRSKSKAKGGNFLGTIGDLVAPTGWGPFATAAGLLALDRADAALRRGTKEKKEKMKGGKKMKGGGCDNMSKHESSVLIKRPDALNNKNDLQEYNTLKGNVIQNPRYILGDNDFIVQITCNDNFYYVNIEIYCGKPISIINYKLGERFNSFDEAKSWLTIRKNQLALISLALLKNHDTCRNPDHKSAFNLRKTPPPT